MPELLSPFAPLHDWLLKICARNLRVVRNPDDSPRPQDLGDIEIISYDQRVSDTSDIMLRRCDGPFDPNLGWRWSGAWLADCRDFATRALILDALDHVSHARPWALGRCWSGLTDEQAARTVGAIVSAVGPDPGAPSSVLPTCILGLWHHSELNRDWRRSVCYGKPHPDLQDGPHVTGDDPKYILSEHGPGWGYGWWAARLGRETCAAGRAACDAVSVSRGALLWEQITPPEKADAP